ncbi:MAG TPA: YfhO family protein [Microvirga sp.]|jgi:hypothetical protein|nr:YfhO family protein [Microvirga sp.]
MKLETASTFDRVPHPDAWTARETWIAVAAVLALWAAAAAAWPLTGTVVPWDSKNHFYPMLRYLGAALEHGELPLWNPYHFSGHPAVADPQSLLFTPTMLLFALAVPQPSMQLFDAAVFAHLLPGALAFIPLFRRRGWHSAGAVIAAAIFMLGGSATARLQHTGIIFSYGFFPLAIWLLEEALERRSYAFGALFAVVAVMMTVGRDQVAFLSALTLIGVVVHHALRAPDRLAWLRGRIALLAAIAALGGALLAVPTILTMQLLATSTRPSFGFGVAAMGSLPPESLATVLFGNVFGSLRLTYDYWGPDWQSLAGGTWTDRATNYLFAGTVPALLLLWHGVAGGRLLAREFRFFLVVGGTALVYSLGHYTPLFELIFDHVPGVKLYRRPADATFLINVVLAFAAGYLVHRYVREGSPRFAGMGRRAAAALPLLAMGLVAAAVAGALVFAAKAGQLGPSLREIGFGLLLAAGAMALAHSGAAGRRRAAVAAALVALTGGELVWRHAASALNAEPAERYAVFRELPPEQLQGLQVLKAELAERHAKGERPRVEILGLGGAWQNASMVLQLEDTIGYNPLRLADYERAVGPGENAVDPNLRQFPATFRGYRCRLASLLGLEYLLLDRPVEKLPRHFPRLTGTSLLYGSGQMWIYRLEASSPRVYLASVVSPVDSDAVLDQDELPEFDRSQEALVDEASMPLLAGSYGAAASDVGPLPARASARIVAYSVNDVVVEVESDKAGVLVLHDLYYPGWEVRVDGEARPLLRANLLFRGVEVPAGRHRVAFSFRPLSMDNLVAAAADLVDKDGERAGEPATRTQ